MPLELVATAPRTPELREYEERAPGPGEVLVRSTLCVEKHGTHLLFYRGETPFAAKSFDGAHNLFRERPADQPAGVGFPFALGNATVGHVAAVGEGVEGLQVGDRVYGSRPIRASHTGAANAWQRAPATLSDEALVCLDPAMVALMGVREGEVRLGEVVAVFGLGAIGLMAVQLAKAGGAAQVIAVEPVPLRAELGRRYGADLVVDPRTTDAGLAVREATGMLGADITLETSGAATALHQAIRATAFNGTVVTVAWYHEGAGALFLGEEWHFNRQRIISGARLETLPFRDAPRWDPARIERTALQLLEQGKLAVEGMLQPRVPITQAAEAYRLIDEHPDQCVKLAVDFPPS